MSVSCLIFDDDAAAIAEVSFLIGKHAPSWTLLGIASTTEDCKKQLSTHKPDVIFSDIHFGEDIIFDVLPELQEYKGDIIFISGDNGYAMQAFQMSAVNYILKPINENYFVQSLQKYNVPDRFRDLSQTKDILYHNLREKQAMFKKISFSTNIGYIIKELSQIIYAKAQNNYTEFYFAGNEKVMTTKTMLDYEKMLEPYGFFRIHQSYLVNLRFVERFDSENLKLFLDNKETLPVSNRKKTSLLEMMKRVF